jgi:hypothetical protein
MRRFWKQWVGAVLTGTAMAAGTAALADDAGGLPKVGETITLRFQGQPEQKMTVVKVSRNKDGSIKTDLKDPKTGEIFTLNDGPAGTSATSPTEAPATPAGAKDPILPRAKPRAEDPITSATPPPEPPKERRFLGGIGKLFNRDQPEPQAAPAPAAMPDEGKRPGLLNRIFGPKKPATPAMNAPALNAPAPQFQPGNGGPVFQPAPGPQFQPNNTGPVFQPPVFQPGKPNPVFVTPPNVETPQVMPAKPIVPPSAPGRAEPVAPPTPAVPAPLPTPSTGPGPVSVPVPMSSGVPSAPSVPVPAPLPAKPVTTPALPPLPAVPAIPPVSMGGPAVTPAAAVVRPVDAMRGHILEGQIAQDIRPFALALRDALAPSERLTAARALSQCRHASSDDVKALLFHAAKTDPCPAVRAACVDHLCALGFFHPAFLAHIRAACTNPSESDEVRESAKMAMLRMTPRQW